jgi:fumarate reductase subunit C
MTTAQTTPGRTRTSPARPPDGLWLHHAGYRSYILFSATGVILALDALIFLRVADVLGQGPEAWASFLAAFRQPLSLVYSFLLLFGTLFFAIRFLRVGVKVFTVRIGTLPAPPGPVVLVGQFAGFVVLTALTLLLLGGVIL